MVKEIPQGHPLRKLFRELTARNFIENVRVTDFAIIRYVSELLVEFVHADNLYKIRDAQGRRLDEVALMLMEVNPAFSTRSIFDYNVEIAIRKHIGDYTLFITGIFPESLKRKKGSLKLDYFIDYIKAGKESYRLVSEFASAISPENEEAAILFRKLADQFDFCVVGLNFVRADLDRLKQPEFVQMKNIILN